MKDDAFSIRIAAQQSGLTPFLIRAWERRYNAVEPIRTPSNQRRYTRENIERLTKLRRAVDVGYRIGDIAHMSDQELDSLVVSSSGPRKNLVPMPSPRAVSGTKPDRDDLDESVRETAEEGKQSLTAGERYIERALFYIDEMNESGLEALLSQASISMTQIDYLDSLVLPLTRLIGTKWHIGEIRISQEHMATWVIKSILSGILRSYRSQNNAPMMVVTTPAGQRHEIGALAVAISGAHCGWNVTYLGPDLPAEEIAAMAVKTHANLVALSLVYPADDPLLPDELSRLKHLLPRQVSVIAGGSASAAYKRTMDALGIFNLPSLAAFREYLHNIRNLYLESDTDDEAHFGNF
ncbi:MAG TPA: MerR family transcriptional regulator [bacterium]|nr:MerR family transcriptional regulator [bacterium]